MTTAAIAPYLGHHPAAAIVWVITWIAAIAYERSHTHHRRADATSADRGSHLVFLACVYPGIALLVLLANVVPGAAIHPAVAAFAAGEVIFLAGFGMRVWSIRTLGHYFTYSIQTSADQPVIDTGPYRLLRHPSYLGLLLYAIGAGALVGNWAGLAAFTLLMLIAVINRIRVEERALERALGDPYRAYEATRKRLIPLVW